MVGFFYIGPIIIIVLVLLQASRVHALYFARIAAENSAYGLYSQLVIGLSELQIAYFCLD